jgi:hypothetical protein
VGLHTREEKRKMRIPNHHSCRIRHNSQYLRTCRNQCRKVSPQTAMELASTFETRPQLVEAVHRSPSQRRRQQQRIQSVVRSKNRQNQNHKNFGATQTPVRNDRTSEIRLEPCRMQTCRRFFSSTKRLLVQS